MRKAFHQLDTFVATIEDYIVRRGKGVFEKLTASRLHIYFVADENDEKIQMEVFRTIACCSHMAEYVSKKISKYNNVLNYEISVGLDYGDFSEFEFVDKETRISETTTIGSPANRAAKMQSSTTSAKVVISNNVYEMLSSDLQHLFFGNEKEYQNVTLKYAEVTVYDGKLKEVEEFFSSESYDIEEEYARTRANRVNISDVEFSDATVKVDYRQLSLRNNKQVNGIMLFADIRGFTRKFDPDGDNLKEMEKATEKILRTLYTCVLNEDGVHVQFQGDRISAFFHKHSAEEQDYIIRAYKCALSILDEISELNQDAEIKKALDGNRLEIGVGCGEGDIYATRLGRKNQTDNVAMGQTVREADYAEDNVAGVGIGANRSEVAVTEGCYKLLSQSNVSLAASIKDEFKISRGKHRICQVGLKKIVRRLEEKKQEENYVKAQKTTQAKPWRP